MTDKPFLGPLVRFYFTVPTDATWGTLRSGPRRFYSYSEYAGRNRYHKPGRELDFGRFPRLKQIKRNPLLTRDYLATTPAWVREAMRAEADLLVAQHLAAYPPEPVGRPEAPTPRKRGRPPKGDRAMTGAERARKHYYAHKTPAPHGRNEAGVVHPSSLGLAAPVNPYAEIEQLMIATLVEFQQAERYERNLSELMDRLRDAPPDYRLTKEEFQVLAMAAAFQRATNRREVH